jgi:hypothetical protein
LSFKNLTLLVIALMAMQGVVIAAVTRANRDAFDGRPAAYYGRAVQELAKLRPAAARVIRVCWALFVVELVALWFAKQFIYGAA